MLDMGFIHDVRKIVATIPKTRQTLFFSATMPREIADLAGKLLDEPVRVAVTPPATTVERVEQRVIFAAGADKRPMLVGLLADPAMARVIVFTRTKHGANKVAEHLDKAGIGAAAIHGNKSQTARQAALDGFKRGKLRVLVATDIAARGIDIEGVSHVVNFELPNVPESYVHRIGRTARAGKDGIAVSFCDGEEKAYLRDIEKATGRRLTVVDPPAFTRLPQSQANERPQPRSAGGPAPSGAQRRPAHHRGEQRPHGQSHRRPDSGRKLAEHRGPRS
jgi:ATP-dependent RNA helicase RhlE